MLLIFVMMLMFGGIAVDVMRFEMRRVALQETMDRAVLSASNVALPVSQTPQSVAQEWFDIAGLGDELTYDYSTPVITGEATASSRTATISAKVRSYNHFMHLLDVPYFESPTISTAQQGVSKIEVILVLDVTGSMGESSGTTTKIAALRTAATNFVKILKYSKDSSGNYTINRDPNNLISIGMVPYSSNVNIPVALRNQFTNVSNLATWDGTANAGVPDINCFEIPTGTWGATALPTDTAMRMAAVADTTYSKPSYSVTSSATGGTVTLKRATPVVPNMGSNEVICNHGDNTSTATNETTGNLILIPTTVPSTVTDQIALLQPRGRTSIAVGMRWGTALMDETARPIYAALRGSEPAMAGRPANNVQSIDDIERTRKIIVLMTDGDHVASKHVRDAYKTGLSPIWRGTDGNFAIRYTNGGLALTGGTRPTNCSGWALATDRQYFAPHLRRDAVRQKAVATEPEGQGTGTSITGACDPLAWVSSTTWATKPGWGVYNASGVPQKDASGKLLFVSATQLDWSEVWRYMRVESMVRNLYIRSGVSGTGNYDTVYNTFIDAYLVDDANMDTLLNTNCTAAKRDARFEVFGIILGDAVVEAPIKNCASPGTGYYYKVTSPEALNSAFEQIAVLISELKLTQ